MIMRPGGTPRPKNTSHIGVDATSRQAAMQRASRLRSCPALARQRRAGASLASPLSRHPTFDLSVGQAATRLAAPNRSGTFKTALVPAVIVWAHLNRSALLCLWIRARQTIID